MKKYIENALCVRYNDGRKDALEELKEKLPPESKEDMAYDCGRNDYRDEVIKIIEVATADKLERCGFCGVYFRGSENLTDEEIKKLSEKELNEAPLGYCSNANQENAEQNPEMFSL